jgi:thiol-disulfide isomerase/thioredoxin
MRPALLAAALAVAIIPLYSGEVPRKAPELSVVLPNGTTHLLSQYKGKVVVIEFMFTTCPHCQTSAQLLTKLQNEYGPKGFQVLAVAFNPMSKMLVPDFVRDFKVNFPIGYAERPPVTTFLQHPDSESLTVPQIVFVDRKGVIRGQSLPMGDTHTASESFLRKNIEQMLAEPAGAAPAKAKSAAAKKKAS